MSQKPLPLKHRLAAQLVDLSNGGKQDREIAGLVGGLAMAIADKLKKPNWLAAKSAMGDAERMVLLADFDKTIPERLKQGHGKHVYAMQLLGISVAVAGDPDPELRDGEKLLDDYIVAAEKLYRAVDDARKRG